MVTEATDAAGGDVLPDRAAPHLLVQFERGRRSFVSFIPGAHVQVVHREVQGSDEDLALANLGHRDFTQREVLRVGPAVWPSEEVRFVAGVGSADVARSSKNVKCHSPRYFML
ncbi:hypothetical protein O1M07_33280 [Streptomyces albulus]|nr:hypothetical protein [Streptomyces noursei]MCZ1018956.1 hypothetical protein [Streptomyces noursei]GGX56157.1 hypothetical protein GCM10010341_90960 [Streptomyces noursei]